MGILQLINGWSLNVLTWLPIGAGVTVLPYLFDNRFHGQRTATLLSSRQGVVLALNKRRGEASFYIPVLFGVPFRVEQKASKVRCAKRYRPY